MILLRALLAKNKIPEKDVTIVTIGADMAPLMTGQVDVVTGWLTNTTALKVLGDQRVDMRLWDTGVKLYALPYYATATTLKTKADVLAKFLRASGKGWAYASANRDKAVEHLVKEFPNLVAADEREALDVMLQYSFTAEDGAGRLGHDGSGRLAGSDRPLCGTGPVLQAHAEAGRGHDDGHPQDDRQQPPEDRLSRDAPGPCGWRRRNRVS